MNIVNAGYNSTNYYALDVKGGKLLIDCGWPGTLPSQPQSSNARGSRGRICATCWSLTSIRIMQASCRISRTWPRKFILLESQPDFIAPMAELLKRRKSSLSELPPQGNLPLAFKESRKFREYGLQGEFLSTPGHSEDSVSLVLDEELAFTGDLQPRFMLPEEDVVSRASWDRIYEHKITRLYSAHGG